MPKLPKVSLPRIKLPSLPSIPYDKMPGWVTPQLLRRLTVALGACVFTGIAAATAWHGYTASQPEYTLRQIEQALREHDTKRLAEAVDRDALTGGLVRELTKRQASPTANPVPNEQELTKAALAVLLLLCVALIVTPVFALRGASFGGSDDAGSVKVAGITGEQYEP